MKAYEAFRRLLLELHQIHGVKDEEDLDQTMRPLWNELISRYTPVGSDDIHRLIPTVIGMAGEDLFTRRRYIYLEPPRRQSSFIPVMTLKWQFADEPYQCRCYVAMWSLGSDDPSHNPAREGTKLPKKAIGFRFELAEGNENGSHNYAHLQLIRGFERGAPFQGVDWLPDSQPAAPLHSDASDPVGLLLCVVTALYGPKAALRIHRSLATLPGVPKQLVYCETPVPSASPKGRKGKRKAGATRKRTARRKSN